MAEIATLATIASAAAGTAAAGYGVMKSKEAADKIKSQPVPKQQEPARAPDPEDPRVLEERRRRMEERQAAGGRESTNLAPSNARSYVNTVLGD